MSGGHCSRFGEKENQVRRYKRMIATLYRVIGGDAFDRCGGPEARLPLL